jgi:uncharacterized protein (DUF488 family)
LSVAPDLGAEGGAAASARLRVLTFGHGVASQTELETLLSTAGVGHVVDVRRFPSSRRNPHVNRGTLERWLTGAGIAYRWEERLGGRRDVRPGSPHTALRDEGIRAYADHLGSEVFAAALAEVLAAARSRVTALMCAESSWRRCHRRLIADRLVLLDHVEVLHLDHDGGLEPHAPSPEVRLVDARLIYDAGAPTLGLDP